ncbi:MAG: gliding motility-associated C-terminal domain-containing protein [Bacteroidetes bacterium]|nr:gliding motility-associated C-terminal domain-containing protein [Bacteroidota bacterium]
MKKILLSLGLLIFSLAVSAQQYPCPFIDAGPDQTLPCGTNCTNLTATWLPAYATTSYTLSPISYTPYNYLTGVAPPNPFYTQDDFYSGIINLPFTFCFFGNAYNQCVIGNNGMISFNTAYAGQYNPWNLQPGNAGNNPLPSPQNQLNSIMGPYMDIYPGLLSIADSNYINYATFGTAPCRKFVVSYYQVPYFGCTSTLLTSQIVLYETTNVIEVYIGNKQQCTTWNSSLAIEGIQNATGTVAYPVPGRNVTQWTAQNDGYRWSPSGNSIVTVDWFQGSTPLGSGATVSVCPPNNHTTTYTAVATYNGCGNPVQISDNVTVHVLQSAGAAQFVSCPSPTTSITTNATGTGTWTPIPGNPAVTTIVPPTSPTATITGFSQPGDYLFEWSSGVCSDTLTVHVTQRPDAGPDQIRCRYDTAQMNAYGTGTWSALPNNPHATHIDSPTVNHSLITGFDTGGAYNFVWTTGPGCSDTVTVNIPFFDLATSTSSATVCQFSNTTVSVTPSTSNLGPFTYQWLQPNLVQSPTSSTTLINALAGSTWFRVQVTSADGCKLTDSVLVNTSPNIGTNIRATAMPNVVCPGDPVTLKAYASPNSCGAAVTPCTAPGTTVIVGTGTSHQGGAAFVYTSPYGAYYTSAHHQFLIHANEIIGQVPSGGQIKSLSLQINSISSVVPLTDFTIKLACVGNDSIDQTFLARGSATTVFTASSYTPVVGWNNHTFQTPYDWDGVSNLVVDICFTNPAGSTGNNPKMKYTTTPFKSVWCSYASTTAGQCGVLGVQQNTPTTYASLFQRPNMKLNMCITDLNTANLMWSPGPPDLNAPTPLNTDSVIAHPQSAVTYQVALTSPNGCINYAYAPVSVDTSAKLTLNPDTFVCSIQPIQLNAALTGDSARPAQATYTWTASQGTAPPSGTGSGFATAMVSPTQTTTYVVSVTGGSRCTLVDSMTVTVGNGLPVPKLVDSITCAGQNDGRIYIRMNAGVPPYTYIWSSTVAGNVDSAINLGPGTYTVSVTDAQGCSGRDTTTLVPPAPLTLRLDSVNIPCYGGSTGSVTATVGGGRPGYTYVWSTSGFGPSLTNQPAGTYTVQVFDNSGCSVTGTTHITQPAQLVSGATTTSLTGAGLHDGTITVTTSGGTPGYTYSSVPTLSGLPNAINLDTGTYIITVCDVNNCCVQDTAHVSGPPPINVIATITNNDCYGQCNGQISVTASGGVAPYTYSWNTTPPSSGQSISGLCAGSYTVVVTDSNGISVSNTYPVTAPPALGDHIDSTLITCYGAADGALSDSAYGGMPPYTITWTPGGPNPLSGLNPGTYAVQIIDANGCILNDQASLGQPPQLVAVLDSVHPTMCYGSADGTAWITVSGGTPPYDITWSGSNATTTVASDLDAGTHTATITDAHGCSTTVTATITQPQQIVSSISTTAAHCESSNDGSATVMVNGGTAPYSYNWDNSFGSTTQNNLSSGSHMLIVTDFNNCTVASTFTVDTQYVLHLAMTSTPVSCFDGNDGTATVTALNGAPVASYDWASGSVVNPATDLYAGYESVTVTDGYGCTAVDSVLITEPPQLVAVPYFTNPLCKGDHNGKIWLTASGGQGPYYYTYNGLTYQMTDTITGLGVDNNPYFLIVYDSKGCSQNVRVDLTDPPALAVDTVVTQITCANALDGAITANGIGGTPGYTYSWSPVSSTSNTVSGLAPGIYSVSVTDANGCTVATTVTLVAPPPISVTDLHADSVSCVGATDGLAQITVTGGTPGLSPAYTYAINGGTPQESGSFYDLAAGVYQLVATDGQGCHLDTSVTVETPLPVNVAINPMDTTLDLGGSITLNLIIDNPGGQTITAYAWSPSSGLTCIDCPAPVATPYQRQDYTVVVTYGKNCIATATATVRVDHGPDTYIPNAFTPNGDGNNDEFTVYGSGLKTVTMRIFNRWGEKVFDSGDNQWASWNGTYKGVLQPPAVYTYVVELTYLDGQKKIKDGSLTLIR